jgi:hypothetical protein
MARKRRKTKKLSAPMLLIKAVDRATVKEMERAVRGIMRSSSSAALKMEAVKALRASIEPRPVNVSNCYFTTEGLSSR